MWPGGATVTQYNQYYSLPIPSGCDPIVNES